MLRHATRCTSVNYIQRKHHVTDYTVVRCPEDYFSRGARFSQIEVKYGLADGCWPDGMIFTRHGQRLIVRGRALVAEA